MNPNGYRTDYSSPGTCLLEFSRLRVPDDHAISDLAMYNYIEVRAISQVQTLQTRDGGSSCAVLGSQLSQ